MSKRIVKYLSNKINFFCLHYLLSFSSVVETVPLILELQNCNGTQSLLFKQENVGKGQTKNKNASKMAEPMSDDSSSDSDSENESITVDDGSVDRLEAKVLFV